MKKLVFAFLCLTALVSLSCVKEEVEGSSIPVGGTYCFIGRASDQTGVEDVDTKLTFHRGTGGYTPKWQNGDRITIYKTGVNAKWGDALCDIPSNGDPLNETTFKNFVNEANEIISKEDYTGEVLITFPSISGDAGAYSSSDRTLTGEINTDQSFVNYNASHLGKYGFSYAVSRMSGQANTVQFILKHLAAYGRIILDKTQGYKDYAVVGMKFWADGVPLSGAVTVDIDDGNVTYQGTSDYVNVTYSSYMSLSSNMNPELFFACFPADLRGKDAYVILQMKKVNQVDGDGKVVSFGTETITIPIPVSGLVFEKEKMTTINLSIGGVEEAVKKNCPWYDTRETSRDLLGAWAYGPQNTWFGYQANSASRVISLDVRARGDFSKVEEPKYYRLYTNSAVGSSDDDGQTIGHHLLCYINNEANITPEYRADVPDDYMIDISLFPHNVTRVHPNGVTKKPVGKWAVVAIYNAEKEVLWSYMIWRYKTGYDPKEIDYGNGVVLMDRCLGADENYTYVAEKEKTIQPSEAYFQWGRKDPMPWSNVTLDNYQRIMNAPAPDVATSILNPGKFYVKTDASSWDWKTDEHSVSLWGNDTGVKTIYDPCPAGYKVPDAAAISQITSRPNSKNTGVLGSGVSSIGVDLNNDGDHDDYWPFFGYLKGADVEGKETLDDWGEGRTYDNLSTNTRYWASSAPPPSDENSARKASMLYWSSKFTASTDNRANAFTIRCMKYSAEQ